MKKLLLIVLLISCKKEVPPPTGFAAFLYGRSFTLSGYYSFVPDSTGGGIKCDIWGTLPDNIRNAVFPGTAFATTPQGIQFLNRPHDLALYDSTHFVLSRQAHDTTFYSYFKIHK